MGLLKTTIEESSTRSGRAFDIAIQILIIVSLVSFSIETLPDLTNETRQLLRYMEIGTVAVFTIEYLLRIVVADRRFKFIFSFFGLIDLAAILPFYLATGLDLRSIRVVRLLRLFRLLKLVRYSSAIQRFHVAFLIAKEELLLFFMVSLMLFFFAAVGIYYFENEAQPELFSSVFHSLWWAVVTLTTVGYGDVYPVTTFGRVIASIIMLIGIGMIAVPTSILASTFSDLLRERREIRSQGDPSE